MMIRFRLSRRLSECGRTVVCLVPLALVLAAVSACSPARECGRPGDAKTSAVAAAQASIGTATMLADGTIVLDLRTGAAPGGAKGDARLNYPPGHPQYREIMEHVGGLRPGETKSVPPWTDE